MKLLKFSTGNAKLANRLIFSLPAGYSCPHAGVCKTFADRTTGAITDLPQFNGTIADEFRCFAAMAETRPNVREARWYNWDLIREVIYSTDSDTKKQLARLTELIEMSLALQPAKGLIRIHESGDFWTELYMHAWLNAARNHGDTTLYAYTKSLGMWYNLRKHIPKNMYFTASYGGTLDSMITQYPRTFKRYARVVYTEQEARDLGLEIDHDDSLCLGDKPFALLVHGSQRAGSDASKALSQRKKQGDFVGYGKSIVKESKDACIKI
jgi:hypothetical protein